MAITTIEILAQQLTPLAPDVPVLNIDDPLITIDRSVLNTIRLIVPASIPAGNVDISPILLGSAPVQQGQPMLVIRATVTSQGGAFGAGDEITRIGPTDPVAGAGPNIQVVQDLSVDAGQYLGEPLEFPINHTVGFDTQGSGVAGPHRIVMVVKFFEDTDAFSVA
jgi:hypothetical protein